MKKTASEAEEGMEGPEVEALFGGEGADQEVGDASQAGSSNAGARSKTEPKWEKLAYRVYFNLEVDGNIRDLPDNVHHEWAYDADRAIELTRLFLKMLKLPAKYSVRIIAVTPDAKWTPTRPVNHRYW